jgi:uncharacterized repeat protein (TIGR01451 family)
METRSSIVGLAAVSLLAAATAASAAPSLSGIRLDNPAPKADGRFGFAVAGLGDLDGDGSADLAAGAPGAGRAYLVSGSTLEVLHEIEDPENLTGTQCEPAETDPSPCNFGYAVAGVGDVDGDATEDVAVGAPGPFALVGLPCGIVDPNEPCPHLGRAFIFSGSTGDLIVKLEKVDDVLLQGLEVAPLGDVNGDSVRDLAGVAAGSPFGNGGAVAAFSGADGTLIWTQPALNAPVGIKGLVAAPLAMIEDVNGDGVAELIVGADCTDLGGVQCAGRVYVLSGSNGAVVRTHDNPTPLANDAFGVGVAAVGDQDADGVEDYAVAEPGGAASTGSVIHLFSGATGAPVGTSIPSPADERNEPGSTHNTMAMAGVDDKSGDGVPDFWLGASKTGAAYLLTKQSDVLLQASDPIPDTGFGISVSAIGALPGETGLDAVVGAPFRLVGEVEGAGALFLLRPEADLQVEKTAAPASVVPGDTLTHTVTVTNAGPSDALGVAIGDSIPAPTAFVQGSLADDPACAFDAVLVRVVCTPGTLAAGDSFAFDFEVQVSDDAEVPSTVSNTAAVSAATTDPEPSNDAGTAVSQVSCDIVGTQGNDVLRSDASGQSVCGLGGDDVLIGLKGDDVLVGGAGADILHGESGHDVLRGGSGDDRLHGQSGDDGLWAGDGDDRLFGGSGFDQLDGGAGTDACNAQANGGATTGCE